MQVRLSVLALQDIEDIRSFTIDRWGRNQWFRYFAGLAAVFDQIAVDPGCGRARDLIRDGMRSLPFQRHLIFFQPSPDDGRIAILRIVHERRNFGALTYLDDLEDYPHP